MLDSSLPNTQRIRQRNRRTEVVLTALHREKSQIRRSTYLAPLSQQRPVRHRIDLKTDLQGYCPQCRPSVCIHMTGGGLGSYAALMIILTPAAFRTICSFRPDPVPAA